MLIEGDTVVKLYHHPISTTSRTVMLFAAESGIPLELKVVDLFTGEHMQPGYASLNPNKLVPTLEDSDRADRELGDPRTWPRRPARRPTRRI
jgi:glutathione S-transferase